MSTKLSSNGAGPMIKLENILVPTDFSDCSKEATAYACELANRFDARVQLLHVLEPLHMAMPSPGAPLPDALLADHEKEAERALGDWPLKGLQATDKVTRSVVRGQPFLEIIQFAKEQGVDLIVLGTHGRAGLMHALIGSVAERVVRKSPCPVLTIRPDGHEFVMP